ncbi:hypothetical protein NKH10_29485 [Mesorhizobium sp. M1340]
MDTEVRDIVAAAFERTVGLLTERRDVLERAARRLLETETLDETELASLVADVSAADRAARDGSGQSSDKRKPALQPARTAAAIPTRGSGKFRTQ